MPLDTDRESLSTFGMGFILAVLIGIGWLILRVLPGDVLRTVALLLYLRLIWEIVTRV